MRDWSAPTCFRFLIGFGLSYTAFHCLWCNIWNIEINRRGANRPPSHNNFCVHSAQASADVSPEAPHNHSFGSTAMIHVCVRFYAAILAVSLLNLPVLAATPTGSPNDPITIGAYYIGTVGEKLPCQMSLSKSEGKITGSYFYEKSGVPLSLEGK